MTTLMKRLPIVALGLYLFAICLISACRTTESGLGISPALMAQIEQKSFSGAKLNALDLSGARARFPWFLLIAAIMAGLVMFFASHREPERRTKRRTSSSSRRSSRRARGRRSASSKR